MSKSGKLPRFVDEYEDDEEVELVDEPDCGKNFRSFCIRLSISLFLLACVSGALIWSFVNGESGSGTNEVHRDASKNFSIFVDQYSAKEGQYVTTYRLPEGSSDEEPKQEEYQSFWFQSDTNKTLVHQITPTVTIYAFEHHAYWYDTSASKPEETHNGEKVFVYQGNPNEVLLTNVNQTAFLVTAYADATTGALLAWDTYFSSEADSSDMVYKASYEYPHMTPAKADPKYFITPTECSP
uniref:DUF4309 domain-containing protein n=1 Tax=Caenorhabditis tropicalis TaxID=1561998 RepID=A0A1I7USE9_9PELO